MHLGSDFKTVVWFIMLIARFFDWLGKNENEDTPAGQL